MVLLQNRLQNVNFWSGIEYRTNLNECFKILQLGCLLWKARFISYTVAGQVFYDLTSLPGTLDANSNPLILMPLRVAFNQSPLDFTSLGDIDNGLPSWQVKTTDSPGAPKTPQMWGTNGLNVMFLWPADAAGNGSLQIDAAVRAPWFATDGSDDAKTVNIESGMVGPMLDYCEHIAQIKRGTQRVQATMPKLKSFMGLISKQNSMFAASSIFKSDYAIQQDRRARSAADFSGQPLPARYR